MNPEKFIEVQRQMQENNLENSKESSVETKPKRINSYDYRAWDKFNVDKELEEMSSCSDKEKSGSETDEDLENQRRLQLSQEARELGNIRFKENKFDEAVEQYTMAINLAPEDPIPYTNRALVFLKMNRYASAEVDCSAALQLNKKLVKALFRRAMARKYLEKTNDAIEDLNTLIKLDPGNKTALDELSKLSNCKSGKSNSVSTDAKEVKHNAPPVTRRPLRTIPIVEVGRFPSISSNQSVHSKEVSNQQCESLHSEYISNVSNLEEVHPKIISKTNTSFKKTTVGTNFNINQKIESDLSQTPTNWLQLEKKLREVCPEGLKQSLKPEIVKYLCDIPPNNYLNLFGQNLETTMLCFLLTAFSKSQSLTTYELTNRLAVLCKLPRFDVAWLMADDQERSIVQNLIQRITINQDDITDPNIVKYITVQFA